MPGSPSSVRLQRQELARRYAKRPDELRHLPEWHRLTQVDHFTPTEIAIILNTIYARHRADMVNGMTKQHYLHYKELWHPHPDQIVRRFGSWNDACEAAKIPPSKRGNKWAVRSGKMWMQKSLEEAAQFYDCSVFDLTYTEYASFYATHPHHHLISPRSIYNHGAHHKGGFPSQWKATIERIMS